MKASNLFIDFLVVGFLATVPLLPLAGYTECTVAAEVLELHTILILPMFTVGIYVLGMIFNQMAGYVVDILVVLKLFPSSQALLAKEFGQVDYHESLQLIIARSGDAYTYISYRRSVVRIFRALLVSMSLLSVTLLTLGFNVQILASSGVALIVAMFSGHVLSRNLSSYYRAIATFARVLT